ncbi:MAG: hypothetical protein IPJ31_03875 [Bacteroidetes bacterium]|nr:hypothetical protein [Bacteroidota bacterium]MBP6313909.1 hypothetical protein [Chitinophagaceae bacterium]
MKKKLVIALVCIFALADMSAQETKVTSTEFNKKSQPAIAADFEMSGPIAEGAIKKKMSDAKIKGGSNKNGFITYQEVIVPELRAEKMDVYFKIEDRKTSCTVMMLISKGYENFMSRETDPEVVDKSMMYLSNLRKDILTFGYNDEIAKQEEKVKDLEKDLKKATKEASSLAKDKSKAEGKAAENRNEIAKLKADVDNQNKTLEFVKAKTGTVDQMNAIKKEISKQEDAVKSATKKYESAVKDDADYNEDIQKATTKINENQTEQVKIKTEIESVKAKIAELKGKLAAL